MQGLERGSRVSLHLLDPTTKHKDLCRGMAAAALLISNLSQVPLSAKSNPILSRKEAPYPGLTKCPGSLQGGRGAQVLSGELDLEAGVC